MFFLHYFYIPIRATVLKRRWKKVTTGCLILQGLPTGAAGSKLSKES